MGGIAGVWRFNEKALMEPNLRKYVKKMLNVMTHRGSDIIKSFTGKNVHVGFVGGKADFGQPLTNEDNSVWAVCDGRIYNYFSLREKLQRLGHVFRTDNDVEVLVHLYEEEGASFAEYINGEFAATIYDSQKDKLFLVKDHLGTKPLYYTIMDGFLIFASEMKAILMYPGVTRRLDYKAVMDFFASQGVIGSKTFLRNIKRIEPGSMLIADSHGDVSTVKYWDAREILGKGYINDEYEAVKTIEEKLKDAVKRRLRYLQSPFSSYMSGGIDSTTVSCMIRENTEEPLNTFSVSFGIGDETPFALKASNIIRSNHYWEHVGSEDFWEDLAKATWHAEEITFYNNNIHYYYAARLATKHTNVIFSGEGGDELFCGYESFLDERVASIIHSALWRGRIDINEVRELVNWTKFKVRRLGWSRGLFYILSRTVLKGTIPVFEQKLYYAYVKRKVKSLFTKEFLDKVKGYCILPERLRKFDVTDNSFENQRYFYLEMLLFFNPRLRTEEAYHKVFSVEAVYPFLDREMIKSALRIPPRLLVKNMQTKYMLRKLLEEHGFPPSITKRLKAGFGAPLGPWLRTDLRQDVYELLLQRKTVQRGFFKPEYVKKILNEHTLGKKDHSSLLGALINFEIWCRIFLDNEFDSMHYETIARKLKEEFKSGRKQLKTKSGQQQFHSRNNYFDGT